MIGTVIVLAFPLMNGGPFLYFDSVGYIEQILKALPSLGLAESAGFLPPEIGSATTHSVQPAFGAKESDRIVLGGRSIYYSAFAYAGWATSLWLPIVIQALTLSWLVVTLFRKLEIAHWPSASLVTLTVLTFLSSASFFAGRLMPDIWVGLMLLALAMLWACNPPDRSTRLILFLVLTFSVLVHNSHLALLAAMTALVLVVRLIPSWRDDMPRPDLILPGLALCIGILGQVAYGAAVRTFYDGQLIGRPFITAHLVDMGPGTRLAQQTCPDSGYALCDYVDRLPSTWTEFLFAEDARGIFAAAPPATQQALSAEQTAFALHTLRTEPVATLAGLTWDGLSQLWTLSLDGTALTKVNDAFIDRRFPPELAEDIKRTFVYDNPVSLTALLRIVQATALMSLIFIIYWLLHRRNDLTATGPSARSIDTVLAILLAGVVCNALICGMLASPYGRFQARVVWILPIVSVLVILRMPALYRRTCSAA